MSTETDQKIQDDLAKKEGFSTWMNQPATRMMLSMIPPADKAEVIKTLLQETFNAGYIRGAAQTAVGLLTAMFKRMDKDHKER